MNAFNFLAAILQKNSTTIDDDDDGGGGTPAFYTDNCLGIEEQPQFTLAAELP